MRVLVNVWVGEVGTVGFEKVIDVFCLQWEGTSTASSFRRN